MKRWVLNILVALSQLLNALLCGDPDETLSSRVGKRHPWAARIVDTLFWFDERHTYKASLRDSEEGAYAIPPGDRWQVLLLLILIAVSVILSTW